MVVPSNHAGVRRTTFQSYYQLNRLALRVNCNSIRVGDGVASGYPAFRWEAIGLFRNVSNLITIVFHLEPDVDTLANVDEKMQVKCIHTH